MLHGEKAKIEAFVYVTLLFFYLLPIDVASVGVSTTSSWWSYAIFPLFHANFLHLLINCYGFHLIYSSWLFGRKTLFYAFIISMLASTVCKSNIPTIGFSGVVYALLGFNGVYYRKLRYFLSIAVLLAIGFFWSGTNGMLHLSCFVIAFAFAFIYKTVKSYLNDCRGIDSRKQTP